LRYPSYIAEMGLPASRPRLLMSVRSGYMLVGAFGVLTVAAHLCGLAPFHAALYALVAFKLTTNTAAAIALKTNRFALDASGLNVAADLIAMTGGIYFTGGVMSPLFPIYVIEITVVALLANLGITILIATMAWVLFSSMSILVQVGLLRAWPPPFASNATASNAYVVIAIVFSAFVLGVPTLFTARILRALRDKQSALEAKTVALVDAGREKSQFMANITHELRTPIHGICGLSDLVEAGIYGAVTPKQREATQGIKRSARSLLQLIDDLLELSRADAGKLAYRAEWVDVAELVPNVVATARWMQGTKELDIAVTTEPNVPKVFTDPRKLNQVLLNLLANAVKFTPEGGTISVVTRRGEGDRVVFAVEDTGIGIASQDRGRIFEEFRQADGSAERRFGGAGLGLALVKRLCGVMNGTIEVESAEGEGSTFTFTLPVGTDAAPASAAAGETGRAA
jgi:signal transduction histidine kinase